MPVPTDSPIAESYTPTGLQNVEAGVLDPEINDPVEPTAESVAQPETTPESTPEVTPEPTPEATPEPETTPEAEPTAETPPAAPAKDELNLYANKFQSVDALKDAFRELGGDPNRYDTAGKLEEAYLVRQSEYSRVRAEIQNQPEPPATPPTIQQLLESEFGQTDPAKFETPAEMWQAMIKGFENVLTQVQANQPAPTQGISAEQMQRQIRILENVHSLEAKVPRLKSDEGFRSAFAMHVRVLRDQNRMPQNPDGMENLEEAFRDFLQGQSALVEEANKAFTDQQRAKAVSTSTASDNTAPNPAAAPPKSDDLVDGIIDYFEGYSKKINAGA